MRRCGERDDLAGSGQRRAFRSRRHRLDDLDQPLDRAFMVVGGDGDVLIFAAGPAAARLSMISCGCEPMGIKPSVPATKPPIEIGVCQAKPARSRLGGCRDRLVSAFQRSFAYQPLRFNQRASPAERPGLMRMGREP